MGYSQKARSAVLRLADGMKERASYIGRQTLGPLLRTDFSIVASSRPLECASRRMHLQ
jgi:hypothetical protein